MLTDDKESLLDVKLRIWHPNCWTLKATEDSVAGINAYGVFSNGEKVNAYCVVYGNDEQSVIDLIQSTKDSQLTDEVQEFDQAFNFAQDTTTTPGNFTRGLLVRYEDRDSIYKSMISEDIFPTGPVRIRKGFENWHVVVPKRRDAVKEAVADIEEEENAEIKIRSVTQFPGNNEDNLMSNVLTERQREALELAKARDYYSWPRGTTPKELAEELDITKATFLEHLHKAEAKVMQEMDDQIV